MGSDTHSSMAMGSTQFNTSRPGSGERKFRSLNDRIRQSRLPNKTTFVPKERNRLDPDEGSYVDRGATYDRMSQEHGLGSGYVGGAGKPAGKYTKSREIDERDLTRSSKKTFMSRSTPIAITATAGKGLAYSHAVGETVKGTPPARRGKTSVVGKAREEGDPLFAATSIRTAPHQRTVAGVTGPAGKYRRAK